MAQKLIEFKVQPAPVQSVAATLFTLASFDVASLPGGIGNITDCTVFVRSRVLKFEVGGNNYSSVWERIACFRRASTGNPSLQGSEVNGNSGTAGDAGSGQTETLAFDATGTTIRLQVTPVAGTHWWWCKLDVAIVQGA